MTRLSKTPEWMEVLARSYCLITSPRLVQRREMGGKWANGRAPDLGRWGSLEGRAPLGNKGIGILAVGQNPSRDPGRPRGELSSPDHDSPTVAPARYGHVWGSETTRRVSKM